MINNLLSFNNCTLTKAQWQVVLRGCNLPKSTILWSELCKTVLVKVDKLHYTLNNLTETSLEQILQNYKQRNKQAVAKNYKKKQVQKQAKEFKPLTFYVINGCVTTTKPTYDF